MTSIPALDAAVMTQISQLALEQGIEVTNIDSGTDPQLKQVPFVCDRQHSCGQEGS